LNSLCCSNLNNPFYFAIKGSSSPYINRFIQPDTIIPDPSNPQAWNRYSYVGNNPVNFNDPTGHCPTCLAGLAIGAIAGAAIYAGTTWSSGRAWNNNDYLASVAVGAIGGGLVGTGIGIGAGIATFAAIGAGTGVIGGQLGYSASSGKDYDSGEMLISAGVGGAAGAMAGGISGGTGLAVAGVSSRVVAAATTKVTIANAVVYGSASTAQYELTSKYNGQEPTWRGRGASFGSGAAASLLMDGITGAPITSPAVNRMAISNNPKILVNGRPSGITGLLLKDTFGQSFRSAAADFISRKWEGLFRGR
jgi:hypothetical protein